MGNSVNNTASGNVSGGILPTDKVVEVAERLIAYYEQNAWPKERFSDTLDRLGTDKIKFS